VSADLDAKYLPVLMCQWIEQRRDAAEAEGAGDLTAWSSASTCRRPRHQAS
jgi:hypothetical protein